MSLTDQIKRERDAIKGYEEAIKEAREKLYDAKFVTKHDARRKHADGTLEDRKHWERRRKRNREAYERRDEVVEHLAKKKKAHERLLKRLQEKKEEIKEERAEERADGGFEKGSQTIVTFDGKPLVEDLAYWLYKARHTGAGGQKWNGYLVSGYRSPEYSEQLCYGICGHPSCPGLCAGRTSNHTKTSYPGPAADVTDYINCEEVLIDLGSGYHNNLPRDLVHMSKSGG